jgi:hypothetical protein
MKKSISLLIPLLFVSIFQVNAQLKPTVTKAQYFDKTPPLREMKFIEPEIQDQSWKEGVEKNKLEFPRELKMNRESFPDPVWQSQFGNVKGNEPFQNFDGTGNVNGVMPPDTDGDVGPNHYIQMINDSFQIFDKEGNSLYGPADNSTLWNGFIGPWTGHNDGDPVVVYDELADRWVASQFALRCEGDKPWWELVAVSATSDPLGEWYRYAFEYPVFNDYPKLSVWPDAYYCSFNLLGDYARVGASAYERQAMLVGDTNARHVFFDLPQELATLSMLPADYDGTPPEAGTPCYWTFLNDDDFSWWTEDLIRVWAFDVDWNNPNLSTFNEIQTLTVEPFTFYLCSGGGLEPCIPQPDGAPLLDALTGFSMQPLQYRNFGNYETMVFNHTVNADGNGLAGIRWYELRKENEVDGWYIYQQGTYAPDEHYRWMGSIAMDARGYIALGYTVSSTSVYPSLRYTGRHPDAPLGEMTFTEEEIIAGGGSQTGSPHRWGDYSMMAVDPSNDTTFWYTGEYMATTSGWGWSTRIAAFNLLVDETPPAAISDLQAQNTTTNEIELNWTATGNDGNEGTAYYYDIRYSTELITEDNWEEAIVVENEMTPAAAGTLESYTAEGLDYSTEYYFAVKVGDKQNNLSDISNSPTVTVLGPPSLMLDETEVSVKLFEPGVVQRPYAISNEGETDINYTILKEIVLTGNEGSVIDTMENNALYIRGLTWAEGYLYIVERIDGILYKYDAASELIVDTFDIHNEPNGICWDGDHLWIGDNKGLVRAYNLDGTSAGLSFNCPFDSEPALAYNGMYFVVAKQKTYPKIYFLDEEGNEKALFNTNIITYPLQFTWADDHYGSNLWYLDGTGKTGQLSFTGDSALISMMYEGPGNNQSAIAHDGANMWQGEIIGPFYVIDDGVDEISWFTADPEEGIVSSESTENIMLVADLTTLPEIDTLTLFNLMSNDPISHAIQVSLSFHHSVINLGADTSFCSEQSILLDAGKGYKDYLWSDGSSSQVIKADSAGYGLGSHILWAEATDYGGATDRDTIVLIFEDCTGIEEIMASAKVSIIPNPNEGVFDIVAEYVEENMKLQVIDINGRVVYSDVIKSTGSKLRKQIDLSEYPKGLYTVKLFCKSKVCINKVLIQ